MTTDALKKQAREHEQSEAWEKALQLYRRALDATDVGEEPEIALFNRVADLELRLGNVEAAIEQYERAIDLYLASDLPNNAIAICRKILRSVPGRAETFLRMGQIRAKQGFGVDARQNVLTYAEMMESRGESEAATAALEELIAFFPEDAEARLFLGERLVGLGDLEGGLRHLTAALTRLQAGGSPEAEALEARIRELDPDGSYAGGTDAEADMVDADAEGWSGMELPVEGFGIVAGTGGGPLEPFLADPEAGEETDGEASAPEPDAEREGDAEGVGLDAITFGEITLDADADVEEKAPAETGAGSEFDEEHASWDADTPLDALPTLDLPEARDEDEVLPALGELELAPSHEDEAPAPVSGPVMAEALDANLAPLLPEEVEPDPLQLLRDLVERAQDAGDRQALLASLQGLAAALVRSGDRASASAVHEQVLQLDPRDPDALAALERETPPSAPPPPASTPGTVSTRGGFVDLGALVLDDVETPTTRWVVEDERSGDEDADFAQMLSKFKAKVAQHITRDDARASYDLGTAYREMGLVDEAIGMFQQALRSQPGHLASLEMLGQCFLDREEPEVAIRVLERALRGAVPVEDDLLGIYYFLGVSHERSGNRAEAREFYEKVFSLDINFKDVTERLRALR